jgi:HSP20 family molecular chaperone IbpA
MSDNTNITKANQTSSVTQTGQTPNMPRQALAPAVDIAESESGITLLADMPGVSKERLTIKVEGDSLTIEGQAQIDVPDNIELLHSEVRSPYFRRSFTLSRDLDPAKIEATLRNGVLQMHIPKSEEARPKRIEVKVA